MDVEVCRAVKSGVGGGENLAHRATRVKKSKDPPNTYSSYGWVGFV